MEEALGALRRLSSGAGGEGAVFQAAAVVAAAAPAPPRARAPALAAGEQDVAAEGAEDELPGSDGDDDDRGEGACDSVSSELHAWGRAANYQLGFGIAGGEQPVPRPVPFPKGTVIRSVACGQFHSLAVAASGAVFAWGFNGGTSRLGVDAPDGAPPPKFVVEPLALVEFGPGRHVAVKAAAGANHSLVVTSAGRLFAWGSNANGQLGVQGLAAGEGVQTRRPQVVKAPWKVEAVCDAAAGAAHSLCVTETGAVFVWGSNAGGGLGLGAPPAGPAETASPQQLPHLRGAAAVVAAGSVSVVLAAHGDAVIFGALAAPKAGAAADPRAFLPSRVRRRGRTAGAAAADGDGGAEEEAWRTQRFSGAAGGGAPMQSVVLGAAEAFAVDASGVLWSWPLAGPRPCVAEAVELLPEVAAVAVADRSHEVWAVGGAPPAADRGGPPGGPLWRLRRAPGEPWQAERYEHLAQVASIVCGGEHQLALVTYRCPGAPAPAAPAASAALGRAASGEEGGDRDDGDRDDGDRDDGEGGPDREAAGARAGTQRVPSLQQLCEDRLWRNVSPKTLGMVCEVAWELNRPELLDLAFAFLRANSALLFSRAFLPILSQLPFEVLAAFELAAAGRLARPSCALEAFFAGDFPSEDWFPADAPARASPPASPGGSPPLGAAPGGAPGGAAGARRRRRGGPGAGSPSLQADASTPLSAPLPPPASAGGGAGGEPLPPPARGAASGPAPRPAEGPALPRGPAQGWVEVRAKRRAQPPGGGPPGAAPLGGGPPGGPPAPGSAGARPGARPGVAGGLASPQAASQPSPKAAASRSPAAPPAPAPTQTFPLAEFVVARARPDAAARASAARRPAAPHDLPPRQEVRSGPSAILSAAVSSAEKPHARAGELRPGEPQAGEPKSGEPLCGEPQSGEPKRGSWGKPADTVESPANMRDILAGQEATAKPRPRKAGGSGADDDTKCSWGYDVKPSEKPKGRSVYELQRQEEQDKAAEEIREIEELFAALEVAERAEREGPASPPSGRPDGAGGAGGEGAEATAAGAPRGPRRGRGRGGAAPRGADAWWADGGWWGGAGGDGRWSRGGRGYGRWYAADGGDDGWWHAPNGGSAQVAGRRAGGSWRNGADPAGARWTPKAAEAAEAAAPPSEG